MKEWAWPLMKNGGEGQLPQPLAERWSWVVKVSFEGKVESHIGFSPSLFQGILTCAVPPRRVLCEQATPLLATH